MIRSMTAFARQEAETDQGGLSWEVRSVNHRYLEAAVRLPEELDETLRRMMDELKPALKQMFEMIEKFEGVDDLRHYQMPEVLPNGDIIIRRRPDAPEYSPPAPEEPETPPTPPDDDGVTKT